MKKLIDGHTYKKNGASVAIYAVDGLKGVPKCDSLFLEFVPAKSNKIGVYLRPDEALLLIRMLANAVNRTTKSYNFGLIRSEY